MTENDQFAWWEEREQQGLQYALNGKFGIAMSVLSEVDIAVRETEPTPETEVSLAIRRASVQRNFGFTSVRHAVYGHGIPEGSDEKVVALGERWHTAERHLQTSLICAGRLLNAHPSQEREAYPFGKRQRQSLMGEFSKTQSCIARKDAAYLLIHGARLLDAASAAEVIDYYLRADNNFGQSRSAYGGASNAIRTAVAYRAFGGQPGTIARWTARAAGFASGLHGFENPGDIKTAQRTVVAQSVGLLSVKAAQQRMINWRTV